MTTMTTLLKIEANRDNALASNSSSMPGGGNHRWSKSTPSYKPRRRTWNWGTG
jgi:hypothetical protein